LAAARQAIDTWTVTAEEAGDAEDSITLYRPVGPKELALIEQSGFAAFPPRLPEQPIFYPVTNQQYAEQIARDWNAKDPRSAFRGYVTRFRVRASFLAGYSRKQVGAAVHQEYWIPAEDLPAFNASMVGPIEVVAEFAGDVRAGGGDEDE
jgi:hypothetical protein